MNHATKADTPLAFCFVVNADRSVSILSTGECTCGKSHTGRLVLPEAEAVPVLVVLTGILRELHYRERATHVDDIADLYRVVIEGMTGGQ